MTLYSFKGREPKPLPHRIHIANNFTRTDSSTFTELEISEAGYTGPYSIPDHDSETQEVIWIDGAYQIIDRPPETDVVLPP